MRQRPRSNRLKRFHQRLERLIRSLRSSLTSWSPLITNVLSQHPFAVPNSFLVTSAERYDKVKKIIKVMGNLRAGYIREIEKDKAKFVKEGEELEKFKVEKC